MIDGGKHFQAQRNIHKTKQCKACGGKDTDECSLGPAHTKLWGYYKWMEIIKTDAEKEMTEDEIVEARKYTTVKHEFQSKVRLFELVTDGETCFVDMKIWRGIYRELYNLKEWKAKVFAIKLRFVFFVCRVVVVVVPRVNRCSRVASVNRAVGCVFCGQVREGKDITDDHRLYVAWVVQELLNMIDGGKDLDETLTIHLPAPAKLRTMEIYETAWKAPPDKFMDEADYLVLHGDPDTNGKSDRREKREGRMMVKIWEPKIWKLTTKRINQKQRYRDEDPGDSELEQKMVADRLSAYGDSLGVGSSGREKAYGDIGTDDGDAKKPKAKPEVDADVESTEVIDSFFSKAASSSDKAVTPLKASKPATAATAGTAPPATEAKAKGQKSAKAKAKASGKKGRRPESRKELVAAGLRQLRYADGAQVNFFGTEWKNVNRNWSSYLKDLEAEIEDASETQAEEMIVLHRTMKSARLVLVAVNQYGLGSVKARTVFVQERASLALNCPKGSAGDPAYNPWPSYLTTCMKAGILADASTERFWKELCDSDMAQDFAGDYPDQQLTFSFDKIETFCNDTSCSPNEALRFFM